MCERTKEVELVMDPDRLQKILSLGESDPEKGYKFLVDDLMNELRKRGINQSQLHGIRTVMEISFRLGEKSAALKLINGPRE
jgi:hypothetical protein